MDWKPRRNGRFYCAPACGGKCTWKAHQKAKREAKALVKLLGKEWQPLVWENLGWHFEAKHTSECMSVSPSGDGWKALLREIGPGGRWVGYGETPQAAVAEAIREARAELSGIQKMVELVEAYHE